MDFARAKIAEEIFEEGLQQAKLYHPDLKISALQGDIQAWIWSSLGLVPSSFGKSGQYWQENRDLLVRGVALMLLAGWRGRE